MRDLKNDGKCPKKTKIKGTPKSREELRNLEMPDDSRELVKP